MDLKELMKEAGIVGAGGAGFPSYGKLASGADTLVINGAECEPLLYTDYILLRDELSMVLTGIQAVQDYLGVKKAQLCVKHHTAEKLAWEDGQTLAKGVLVTVLPDVYPMGDEIALIYQATGRVVKPGNLPISAGVIVYNVETLYNVAVALKKEEKVTMKWLTIGGNVARPIVVKVPVGTPVSALFKKYGVVVPENHTVLDGGPSMGKVVNVGRDVVTKTTKGFLILPNDIEAIRTKFINVEKSVARAETACCQCTRCTDMCPRNLLGYPIEPHKMVRTAMGAAEFMPQMVLTATLCCGCGVCESLACCQGISPKAVINNYKALLGKNKMRYVATEGVSPAAERDYRMIPSTRWAHVLGVAKYDKVAEFVGADEDFNKVEIMMRAHIGAPSVPVVADGEEVVKGQLIAKAADGLSLPQYASISGRATVIGNEKIIIER
ncbi:MAG: SLBB domain-containing protein [Clostridia bacterium]|nr:SLBB domain-containing protein [Clostridia bacterium]